MSEILSKQKTLIGQVSSNKGNNTVTVLIERKVLHPIYKKYIQRRTKLSVHDEGNSCQLNDIVSIQACRPLSKRKSWKIQKIIERAVSVA
jgi:small subunit ribosomal protein S17